MLVGAHVRTEDPLEVASATGADCVQLFLSDPQSWKAPAPRADAEELRSSALTVYVHAPYLVNLASPNPRIRIPSRKILQQCCDAAADIAAEAVVVHGGHVTAGTELEDGISNWVKALERLESEVPVYLENTAGGDHALARHFEVIARLWDRIGDFTGLGFCLDTCHAHAAGEGLVNATDRIIAITGRIDLLHCNDSKDPEGSGRDRHESLGAGMIGAGALVDIVRRAGAPVICETPLEGVKDDIAFVRAALA